MVKIQADQLANAIGKALVEYQDATFDSLKKSVDKAAKDAVRDLKAESPKRTGAYAKDWAQKKQPQTKKYAYAKVVYNKKHYRLTHLLEKGHKKVNGGMVDARPHIAKVEAEAIADLVKEIKKGIKNDA